MLEAHKPASQAKETSIPAVATVIQIPKKDPDCGERMTELEATEKAIRRGAVEAGYLAVCDGSSKDLLYFFGKDGHELGYYSADVRILVWHKTPREVWPESWSRIRRPLIVTDPSSSPAVLPEQTETVSRQETPAGKPDEAEEELQPEYALRELKVGSMVEFLESYPQRFPGVFRVTEVQKVWQSAADAPTSVFVSLVRISGETLICYAPDYAVRPLAS